MSKHNKDNAKITYVVATAVYVLKLKQVKKQQAVKLPVLFLRSHGPLTNAV